MSEDDDFSNPPNERQRQIATSRAAGATWGELATSFKTTRGIVRKAVQKVERYDEGMAILQKDPESIRGLELIGELRPLTSIMLEDAGYRRLSDLRGVRINQLLRLPNVGRRDAERLLERLGE